MKFCKILIVTTLIFATQLSLACSCGYSSVSERWDNADNVLLVEVKDILTIEHADHSLDKQGQTQGYFDTIKIFKGNSDNVPFLTAVDKAICCICSTELQKGEQYLVFSKGSGPVHISTCSPSHMVSRYTQNQLKIVNLISRNPEEKKFSGVYNSKTNKFFNYSDKETYSFSDLLPEEFYSDNVQEISFMAITDDEIILPRKVIETSDNLDESILQSLPENFLKTK